MKTRTSNLLMLLLLAVNLIANNLFAESHLQNELKNTPVDVVETFKSRLLSLKSPVGDGIYALHFQSIVDVIEAKASLTTTDSLYISATLPAFSDTATIANAAKVASYLDRSRFLTISWVSPTDGVTSFFRLRLPKNWDKKESYPLYVDLHGLTSTADNPIDFLTRYYRNVPDPTIAFEDGYHIAPLARGNLWYYGISETDIWEAIDLMENLFTINPARKYLVGHSMGGFGTWMIASKSPDVWAAIGIEAGALWYDGTSLSTDRIESLSQLPTYFIVGTSDGLYDVNLEAYNLLVKAGNPNLAFVTFDGGHEKLTPNVENMYLWIREFMNEDYSSSAPGDIRGSNSMQISPNPVIGNTTITLYLKQSGKIKVALLDVTGKTAAVILDQEMPVGKSLLHWNRANLPHGVYFCTFTDNKEKQCIKLILQ